jgi:hypothetical protein
MNKEHRLSLTIDSQSKEIKDSHKHHHPNNMHVPECYSDSSDDESSTIEK